ncbi:transglycosylase SLT domain-containing protein [Streptomyces sp. NPDC001222]|uniref:transglycosylase SLT domain-containing protein n=1 Tax=Streptomyces sp. NPDC001222 TaxID=3364548 RepID=UPI0036C1B70F
MLKNTTIRARARALTKTQKLTTAGVAAFGCCAMVLSAAPSQAQTPAHDAPAAASAARVHKAVQHEAPQTAGRSAARPQVRQSTAKASGSNLDGWIRQSLAIMKQNGIPGSYSGIYRNVMRESSGNPMAINKWDVNAVNGIPSKGLLQVIDPTFRAYHVPGTSWNIYDPVANITAACNYAGHRYGSMDNVNSAY